MIYSKPLRVLLAMSGVTAALLAGCSCPCNSESPVAAPRAATAPSPKAAAPAVGGNFPESGVLFDGKSLDGWTPTDFAGRGSVTVSNGQIHLGEGFMTGITFTRTNGLPRMNYEISLDAMRTGGSDFFCGLTFMVGKDPCSFIVGGWGGGTVGISSINSEDASQNETTKFMNFVNGKWYHIRLRVEPGKIQAWIDDERMVDLSTEEKNLSIRFEVEPSLPLGLATWNTQAAYKNIQLKKL